MFFFFQAEDGIRDHCVTGVQTCALPILLGRERLRRLRIAAPVGFCREHLLLNGGARSSIASGPICTTVLFGERVGMRGLFAVLLTAMLLISASAAFGQRGTTSTIRASSSMRAAASWSCTVPPASWRRW